MRRLLKVAGCLLLLVWTVRAWASAGQPHRVHALTNATIYVSPGHVLQKGTLIVRDGRIDSVGEAIPIPADARVWDMHGKILHAGFIDPYVTISRLQDKPLRWPPPPRDSDDEEASPTPTPDEGVKPAAASGPNARVHPDWRVADNLTPARKALEALRADGFVLVQAVPDSGIFRGSAALYSLAAQGPQKQLLRDDTSTVLAFELPEEENDLTYPGSEMGIVALIRQTLSDAAWYSEARKVDAAAYRGVQRPELDTALEALQPVLNQGRPVLFESLSLLEDLRISALEDEMHLEHRMTVLSGEEWRHLDWLRSLPHSDWILPLKFAPAPQGKSDGDWLDVDLLTLQDWKYRPAVARWLAEDHQGFSLSTHRLKSLDQFPEALQQALDAGLSEEEALAALTVRPARALGVSDRFGTLEPGKAASLVVTEGAVLGKKAKVQEVWIEGVRYPVEPAEDDDKSPKKTPKTVFTASDYATRPSAPGALASGTVFIHGATLWTQGPQGTLSNADMIVSNGKIQAVGRGLTAPSGALVIEGLNVTPGIIDCHSHTAIDGDVNEGTLSCTSMVRIKDVLNPLDPEIYRELAGGKTMANVLHGSANSIGGQVVTCKWRWGVKPLDMVVAGAPEGIKFALGENVKQSNWGEKYHHRYPQTRLGVAELIRDRFTAAKEYRKKQQAYQPGMVPVRRDYSLDCLLEILDGKRYVHCHSYRQDEILMLMRLSDEIGFKVRTFQHVLEGYKIADELARYGAGASTFADWWIYKYEVVDAIPYNAALMQERGVNVSINSDDPDLARRLNTEAAKSIRWGGMTEAQALALVTINPARQLGVDRQVGSLEAGKDADFVVWSDDPLTLRAVCLQTWIDGRKYFDRTADAHMVAAQAAQREALLAKLRKDEKPK